MSKAMHVKPEHLLAELVHFCSFNNSVLNDMNEVLLYNKKKKKKK